MQLPHKIKLVNGEETTLYDNTEEAKDVIYDLVVSNDSISFTSSEIVDGLMILRVG